MFSRRHFLQHSALVALSPIVPTFLSNLAKAAVAERDARILVVIQMEGGNDGCINRFSDRYKSLRRRKELLS